MNPASRAAGSFSKDQITGIGGHQRVDHFMSCANSRNARGIFLLFSIAATAQTQGTVLALLDFDQCK